MDREAMRDFLSQRPLFRTVSPQDLMRLAAHAWIRDVLRDEIIALEGDPCQAVYVVVQGRVKAVKTSLQGREQVVQVLGPGEIFYLAPALDGGPLPVTTQAATRARLLGLGRETLLSFLEAHPSLAFQALVEMARRLRQMSALIEDLSLRTVAERLARLLCEQVNLGSNQRMTQREMASRLGTVREVVARTLAQFDRQGWIRLGRGAIEILDLEALRQAAALDEM